jgi:hypothetical protein
MAFAVVPSEEIGHRVDFSILCNARGYLDAVEVGVDLGVFAREFLDRFRGHWLILVDPYLPYPEIGYDRTLDMMTAVHALTPHHGRFRFVRDKSPDCIPWVLTWIKPPTFVYIDGAHDEESVAADLRAWWGVIPEGGMLAGHDWDDLHPGVVAAVERFARERGLVVRLTHETRAPSYYMYKGEPETLMVRMFREAEEPNPRRSP